ncbi:MAG TPA: TRAP transporter small permease subunit [Gammaproteobacteria bacterium]|nr:TRAP transporter small permease subunit [Gammaproteobacteria bacterium]
MTEEEVDPGKLDISDEMIAERRAAPPGQLPDDMSRWMAKTITFIDITSIWIGRIVCLLLIPMCLSMVYEVLARKFFLAPTMWAYDISRMTYGAMFMLGAGYALLRGVHIRADFLYRNWSPRTQGRVDALLYIILYFPGMVVFLYMSIDYAAASIAQGERSMDTAWMPYMGPIKTAIPVGIVFLIMQGISELLKSLYAAKHNRWPV